MDLLLLLGIVFVVLNVLSFTFYGVDKHRAKTGARRIPEERLIAYAVFGPLGALLGMRVFRHKTQKPRFRYGVPAILVIELVLAFCIGHFFFAWPF